MRKRMVILWVSLLCLCGLILPSCGGSSGSAEGDAPAEVAVDPAEKFYGTWKLAALRSQNVTIVGDFSMLMDSEEGDTVTMVIEKGGGGTMSYAKESTSLSWELSGDDTISVKPDRASDGEEDADDADGSVISADKLDFVFDGDALSADYEDEKTAFTLIFTKSGSLADEPEIDMSQAGDFASLEELAGTWNLSAVKYGRATMYGDPADLAALYGDEMTTVLEVGEDGASTFVGQSCTVKVNEEGACIDLVIYQIPVKKLGDGLAIDMGNLLGTDIVFFYAK